MSHLLWIVAAAVTICIATASCSGEADQRDGARAQERVIEAHVLPSTSVTEHDVDFVLYGLSGHGAVPWRDESVLLLDYGDKRLVALDSIGGVLTTFSRAGGGPGELMFPQFLVPLVDGGVGVVDGHKQALVTFTRSGSSANQWALDSLLGVSASRLTAVVQIDDTTWIFSERVEMPDSRYERVIKRVGDRSVAIDSVIAAPVKPTMYPCNVVVQTGQPPVFWPTLRWDASPRAMAVAVLTPYQFTFITRDTTRIIELPVKPREATKAEALLQRIGGTVRVGTTQCTLSREDALDQQTMAAQVPVIRSLRIAPDGDVWVERATAPGERTRIDVFDSDGTNVARLDGIGFPLMFINDSTYVAVDSTSDGLLAMRRWRVRRGR